MKCDIAVVQQLVMVSPSCVFVFGFVTACVCVAGTEPDTSLDVFVLVRSCQTLSRLWPASRLCKETFGPILSVHTWECLCTCAVCVCYELRYDLHDHKGISVIRG